MTTSNRNGWMMAMGTATLLAAGMGCNGSDSGSSSTGTSGSGGSTTTATTGNGSTSSSGASSSSTSQSSSVQATVASTAASTGSGGNGECDPPPPADSLFATSDTRVGDAMPSSLCKYRGDVLLIVNAAQLCGYTPQTTGLQNLEETYGAQGFRVLAFYSNDFGNQGGDPSACNSQYKVTFDTFDIAPVKGANARPPFAWLLKQTNPGPEATLEPQWNYSKYLVSRDGKLVKHWSHTVTPGSSDVVSAITAEIAKPK